VRKNTTGQYVAFQAISKTDGSDVITGTPVVYYTIDGGTQAQTTATAVHEGNGQWSVSLSQAETNGDHIVFSFVLTGAVTQTVNVYTLDADLTNLDVAVSTRSIFDATTDTVTTDAASRTASQADVSSLATAAALATVDANVDSILVDTGTDIPASIAALNDFNPATDTVANVTTVGSVTNPVATDAASRTASQADVSALATAASIAALNNLSSLDVENAVWDASLSSHNTGGTTGKSLKQIKEGTITIESSINDTSATTTSFVTALTEPTTSYYSNKIMVFIDGHLSGQARIITNYNGTTKTITLEEPLTSAPADGDQFLILATHENSVAEIADGVWNESQSGHTTVGTFGYYLDSQVSALSTQASVNTIDVVVDAIKVKTDQLTFTNPNSVDATATVSVDETAIADAVIAGIGGTDVTISSVIAQDGTTITIVRGDDYNASDSRAITWTGNTADQWPSLSGATLKFTAKNNMDSLTVTPTVTQPTGTQAFRMELTKTNTEIMSGRYKYDVQATLSSGRVITLVVGEMIVKQTYTDRP
jgi:hypothetical protein